MRRVLVGLLALAACKDSANLTDGGGSGSDPDARSGDGPAPSTPLGDRLTVRTITAPAGVMAGVSNWRIWGMGNLRVAPVYTATSAGCGYLVGFSTGTASAPHAYVARFGRADQYDTTFDLGPFMLRGLAAESEGTGEWAALLWDPATNPPSLHVTRFDTAGTAGWTQAIDSSNVAPTDFSIGESRLEYGAGMYGAYHHVHGTNPNYFAYGHEGDQLTWLDAQTGAPTPGWTWGCSHSMSELLRFDAGAGKTLPVCVTDCYPGTTGSNFATDSIGGIYLNHDQLKVRDVDGGCNGSVAAELGSLAPGPQGWALVFNAHQNAATNGQSSYNASTMNQDIGFVTVSANQLAGSVVWLTTTPANEANASIARWQPGGDDTEQYVVGWSSGTTYQLARVSALGQLLEGPIPISNARWGERDDPFRVVDSDVVWAWFDAAGSTTLNVARLNAGRTSACSTL